MNLFNITTFNSSKKIRQLNWPKDQYFICMDFYYPEFVEGWLYSKNKRHPYVFYFGGKSEWEIAE